MNRRPVGMLLAALAPAWTLDLRSQLGLQKESRLYTQIFNSLNAGTEIRLGRVGAFGVRVFRGDSNLGSTSGYEQRGWAAYLATGR